VDTNKSAHKGHLPQLPTLRPHVTDRTLTPDRKGEYPKAHLGHFTGTLQADGYAGFDAVYEGGRIQEAACWAHVRRKFYDLHLAHRPPVAAEAMERIAALYAIEKEIRGHAAGERREVRGTRARPLLDSLKQ
jgi:hypothetical protein